MYRYVRPYWWIRSESGEWLCRVSHYTTYRKRHNDHHRAKHVWYTMELLATPDSCPPPEEFEDAKLQNNQSLWYYVKYDTGEGEKVEEISSMERLPRSASYKVAQEQENWSPSRVTEDYKCVEREGPRVS